MSHESTNILDTTTCRPDATPGAVTKAIENVVLPPQALSSQAIDRQPHAPNGTQAGNENGEVRSDSEAETVVLPGKDEVSGSVHPKAIKHEGTPTVELKTYEVAQPRPKTDSLEHDDVVTSIDCKETPKEPMVIAADANNSSNLSSTTSSPTPELNSTSRAVSEFNISRPSPSRETDAPSKDQPSRKRKLRLDEIDDRGHERRRKRDTSSEAANFSDPRDSRKLNHNRSESPATRTRNRTHSTQSLDPQGIQKRRKPPPLQVGHRRKPSEETYGESDGSSSAYGPAYLRKLQSADNVVVSPAKIPHKKHRDKNGRTWLARACAAEEVDNVIARLRERPEDLNVADNAENTPLQIASLEGNSEIVQVLLDAGCDTSCRNIDLDTPLIDAVENGHLDVIRLLLKAGLDPRQSNAKGEEPLDLLDPEDENHREIKAALNEAKGRDNWRRASEDHHGQPSAGRDSTSAQSPRGSPSLHSARSPPLAPRRKTARSEATRNDLLWVNPTPENLRDRAGKGDIAGVDHILNMRPVGDIEAVLAAAKGGHEPCLQLLIAIGNPDHDPDPLQIGGYKDGHNTPMLAAIGRGNVHIIQLLLKQAKFDPTRRLYKNLTYYEIAQERQGSDWQQEHKILKDAYDKVISRRAKTGSPAHSRTGVPPRDKKRALREPSSVSPHPSVKRQSPDTSKDGLPRKRRSVDGKSGSRAQPPENAGKTKDSNRQQLRAFSKGDGAELSGVVSDHEAAVTRLPKEKKTKRSLSDAGAAVSTDREVSKPRKRLVSGKALKNDQERRRRRSPVSDASSSASQDQSRSHANHRSKSQTLKREDSKESQSGREMKLRASRPEVVRKRSHRSITPVDGSSVKPRILLDLPKKPKRRRLDSDGNTVDREFSGPPQPGPAKVANMIPSLATSSNAHTPPGTAPVAIMGSTNASPVKEKPPTLPFRSDTNLSTVSTDRVLHGEAHTKDLEAQNEADGQKLLDEQHEQERKRTEIEAAKAEKQNADELRQKQKRDQDLLDQQALEEARQTARAEEEVRAAEKRCIDEAEKKARLEREEEEARIEKQRKEEELQKRLLERERVRREEQDRRIAEQEERERQVRIRRQKDEERQYRETLPNGLRLAAELEPEAARHSSEVAKWLPLYTATARQLEGDNDEPAHDEIWISNIQAAPILAVTDLALSQCKSFSSPLFHRFLRKTLLLCR